MEPYVHPDGTLSLLPPPEHYVVDFENPQRQWVIEAYSITGGLNLVMLVFVAQRTYVKLWVHKKVDWDDAFFTIALGIISGLAAIILKAYADGLLGTHAWELTLDQYFIFTKALYPMPILYALFSLFSKLSLACFYLRLSPQSWFKWSVWSLIVFIVGSNLGLAIAAALPCLPVEKLWTPAMTEGSCDVDLPAIYKGTAICGLIADISLIAIPVYMTWNLQMPKFQKFGLMVLFALGGITFVTSIIRLVYIIQQLTKMDQTWGAAPASVWALIEAYLIMICATLPTVRLFFRKVAPKLMGTGSATKGSSGMPDTGRNNISLQAVSHQRSTMGKYSRFGDAEDSTERLDSGSERAIIPSRDTINPKEYR